jgi:hypothetical protein
VSKAAMPILTKKQNYRLWQGGEFGNKLRAWRTIDEWRASGFAGLVALRVLGVGGGGPCAYDVLPNEVEGMVGYWGTFGVPRSWIMINEMGPGGEILQGEYLNDIYVIDGEARWGYFLHSRASVPMREALRAAPQIAHGLRADLLIREAMTPSSYEDWRLLLDCYSGHVLEVSIYDRCLGDIPGRNALVWEIRKY